VQHRVGITRCLSCSIEVLLPTLQISIDVIAMREVVRNDAVNLLELQDRKRLRNRLGRLTRQKGVDDRIEGHAAPCGHVHAVTLLDVGVAHRILLLILRPTACSNQASQRSGRTRPEAAFQLQKSVWLVMKSSKSSSAPLQEFARRSAVEGFNEPRSATTRQSRLRFSGVGLDRRSLSLA
jgi:hypothetical protein